MPDAGRHDECCTRWHLCDTDLTRFTIHNGSLQVGIIPMAVPGLGTLPVHAPPSPRPPPAGEVLHMHVLFGAVQDLIHITSFVYVSIDAW